MGIAACVLFGGHCLAAIAFLTCDSITITLIMFRVILALK